MVDGIAERSYGKVFNQVAAEYDRHRPAYPDELIERACELAGIGLGDRVLEIGCGTGQLTRSLLARGLRVTAVEPGERLAALARSNLDGVGEVELLRARFEDAPLPHAHFAAAFSAAAIHWIDPDVGWQRAADALVPGGTLALIQHLALREEHSADDQQELMRVMAGIAPEVASDWPAARELEAILSGVRERRANVSEVWAWLGSHGVARERPARLFEAAEIAAVPIVLEHTADEINGLLGTMSFWARLSPAQREALTAENRAFHGRLGRPIRSSVLACLITARRRACA
ncbi:MAG TPA: class I SAM-dependent methyltransferase [Solirubrobacteraceae bacterium]|nr:class I SAM-dependent methyltransferase [Solirubrobacteraceae bacterium]